VQAIPLQEEHVSETEQWIEQARKYLRTGRWSEFGTPADCLQNHMTRIDLEQVQADLGCGEDCAVCSWGSLGGHPLPSEPCKLLVLQQTIETLQERSAQQLTARQEAAALLELLDSLPSPRKAEKYR
jgi:hypothetical protein